MEDKRTEAEKCNGWLRGMYYLALWSISGGYGRYGDDKDYEDFERDESRKYVKEKFETLVSRYLKMLESNDKDDKEQRIFTIQSIIYHFKQDVGRIFDYEEIRERGIKDPRIFWFRRLVKEDISVVEICRILLTCQELGEFEIGISLGQEYVRNNEKHLSAELSITLVNKHIEVLQEELRARIEYEDREDMENMNSMSISDYRDSLRELEEDSWEAMTGGMYGDYDGDIDMDKLGY